MNGRVLLFGIPSERPLALVGRALTDFGIDYVMVSQRRFAETRVRLEVDGDAVGGELVADGESHRLEDFTGAYIRAMDDRRMPELAGEDEGSPAFRRARAVYTALAQWSEVSPARIVNRVGAMGSNTSKPYQARILQSFGFATPQTLITNDPDEVRAFVEAYGEVVYKSVSSVRSIVRTLGEADLERLELVRTCPTQFQQRVPGDDVRVHVVGDEVFATRIRSGASDYRYAHQDDLEVSLEPTTLPEDLAGRCVDLAAGLGLAFAGLDLRLPPDGDPVCFEANPCPAYSYYESHTGQPIAQAVARYLSGRSEAPAL